MAETAIKIPETKANGKEKAPLVVSSKAVVVDDVVEQQPKRRSKKGIAICDFFFRLCAIGAALGASVTMGTTDEALPFFTQFFQFHAQYNDISVFVYVIFFSRWQIFCLKKKKF